MQYAACTLRVVLAKIKEQIAGAIQLMNNFPSKWPMLTKQCTEAIKSPQSDPDSSESPNKHTHPLFFWGAQRQTNIIH